MIGKIVLFKENLMISRQNREKLFGKGFKIFYSNLKVLLKISQDMVNQFQFFHD